MWGRWKWRWLRRKVHWGDSSSLSRLAGTKRLAPPTTFLGQPAAPPPSRDQGYGGPLVVSYFIVFNIARLIVLIYILNLLWKMFM